MIWALSYHNEKAKAVLRGSPDKLRLLGRIHTPTQPEMRSATTATSSSSSSLTLLDNTHVRGHGQGQVASAIGHYHRVAADRALARAERRAEAAVREGVGVGMGMDMGMGMGMDIGLGVRLGRGGLASASRVEAADIPGMVGTGTHGTHGGTGLHRQEARTITVLAQTAVNIGAIRRLLHV